MKTIFAISTSCSMLLAAGCASTHLAQSKDKDSPYQEHGRIQWNSSNLKSVLRIDKADGDRTADGLLHVRMVIRNKTKKDVFVDMRTVFTDSQGYEKEKTNWEPICCSARTQTTYTTVSLGKQVADYQVLIRGPKSAEPR